MGLFIGLTIILVGITTLIDVLCEILGIDLSDF